MPGFWQTYREHLILPDSRKSLESGRFQINRDSYALNNPLSYTDPSGFAGIVNLKTPAQMELERQNALDFLTGVRDEVINDAYEMAVMVDKYVDKYGPGSYPRQALGLNLAEGPLVDRPANPTAAYESGEWAAFGAGIASLGKGLFDLGKWGLSKLGRNVDEAVDGLAHVAPDVRRATDRLGVDLDNISIENGVARMRVGVTETITRKDLDLVSDHLKAKGATRLQVDSGYIANEKFHDFLDRRVQDGKPFHDGTVRRSNEPDNDFTIDFDLDSPDDLGTN